VALWQIVWLLLVPAFAQERPAPAPKQETTADDRRKELNLLGKEDSASGESRRNENIQFNLVDNNALKELNVRLGASATIVKEFQPDRGYFGTEFGNAPSGGLHLTPSTAQSWRGNAFWNHQNSVFTARSFFQVGDVLPARDNRTGIQTGGRVWRGSYLSLQGGLDRLSGYVNGNVLVPMPEERTPLTLDPDRRRVVERFLAAYPRELPNRTDINPRALNTNALQSIRNLEGGARLEQEFGPRDRLLASWNYLSQTVDAFQLVDGQNPDTTTRSHRARLTWLREWHARRQTMLSAGFDRIGSVLLPEPAAVGPMVSPAGLTTLGPQAIIPIDRAQNIYRYEAQLRQQQGRHNWTAGLSLVRRQLNGAETDAHRGFYGFSNDFGRTGIENLRLGTPSQYIVSLGDIHRGYRQWLFQSYFGGDWRATGSLSLLYGLRWESAGRPAEVHQLDNAAYRTDRNNLAPRFGFAWMLPANLGRARAAFGLHYGEIFPVTYSQMRFSPPGSTKYVIPAPDLLDPIGAQSGAGLKPDALGNLYLLAPELVTPYSMQYNASWEPPMPGNWRLELGYTGSRSPKLLIMWYLNRAHPVPGIPQTTATINQRRAIAGLAEIRWVLNGSRGYYDAGRVTLLAPRFRGWSLDAAYWFSKAMDLGADYTNTAYDADTRLSRSQWEFEAHRDRRARSLFDQPHAFLLRAAYETPARAPNWLRLWAVQGIALLKQGTPFTVTTFDAPGFGNVDGNGGDRPNLLEPSVLGRTIGHPDTSVARLPVRAFSFMSPTSTAGSLGVNTFRRGPIRNVNAALARTFPLGREMRLTVRAESVNLFNTPQFAEPGAVLGAPEFGFITNTLNDGRAFRFGLRFGW
jgi:hypothetical protein